MWNEGDRVGAILSAKDGVVQFLGYGVYDGRHEPHPGAYGAKDRMMNEAPRLKLDNGRFVYGFQCWWGSEAKIKAQLETCKEIHDAVLEDETEDHLIDPPDDDMNDGTDEG